MRIANIVMFLVFASWAVFQYNDPDALMWMVAYGLGALCCALFFFGRLSPTFGAVIAVAAALWALVLLYLVVASGETSFSMIPGDVVGERTREAIGLLILAGWTGFLARRTTLDKRAQT